MELPDAFRTFADMWGRSHAFRGIGLSIDLLETQRALPSIALSSVPGMQDPPGRQALNNAVEAFRALNGSSVAERVQAKRNLDCALRNAILGNDTRNQIDIYEKLAEIYTNLRDWEGVVHVLDKIDDCFEDLGHFCGVNIDERTTLRRRLWMTTRRAQCLKRLGRIAESKEQVRELKKIVKRREDLWTRKDRGNEEYRNILAMIENDIARGRASRGAGERSSESVIGAVYRYRDFERGRSSDSEANSNTPGEEGIIEVLGQILPNRQRDERSIEEQTGIIVAPESVQPSTMPHRGVEDNPRTSAILNDQSITPGPVPGSGAGNTTAAGTDANDGDNVEDADDLYFVLNPWMKPIMNWADTLGGTRAPPQYWKDQAPPGRLGGLFLWEARAFMADAFLRAIGVIETRVPD
ncbi:hypothetical protein BKA67DRAFT_576858 [Truncatella angustata]|uniref:Uncharacterized protein n=1 Tax=Truncatella angustata TaxID=152316 RepID=A0A9P8UG05_9PEZI|nr:uncharacterized protein BKA67DRAFT_576858 [Truncatella angustata]KAH6649128.1 hypothetical protein BKA67DRAFT_576858 [Truncatella angustata]